MTAPFRDQQRRPRHISALRSFTLALCLSLAGATAVGQDLPQALVKIDGFMLNSLHFALFASQTGREPQEPEEQLRLLNELINNFMIANSPQGKALAQDPELVAALEVVRARLITQSFIRSELQKVPVEEAQIQARYDAEFGQQKRVEYKARHILVASEQQAREVIEALDRGEDFATLAAERSIGPSKSVGGDLGWFESDQMVEAFSDATAQLADGSYSKEPVKTEFGWHVILREQSRETPPPSLESVRAELEQQIRQEQVAKLVNEIREQTEIEVQPLD